VHVERLRTTLQRQWLVRDDQVGKSKAHLAAAFAEALNPSVRAVAVTERIGAGNAGDLTPAHDLVLDGSDNFATRLTVSDATTRLKVPLVSAAAAQFQGQVGLFRGWEEALPCYRC